MELGPKKRAKPRLRFNFSAHELKKGNVDSARDDILDSLTKQAHDQDGPIEQQVGLRAESSHFGNISAHRNHHAGRSAFLLFMGGFLAIWAYGYLTKAYEIPYFSAILGNQAVNASIRTVAANPLPAGLVSAGALIATIFALRRRKSSGDESENQHGQPVLEVVD